MTHTASAWWRHAVVYQVYIRSFADSDGDGIGDLPGITDRLPYLRDLGVDAVWITPFYRSPQRDHGYDVADYCDVDPLFGTLDDADALLARAHELGLRVIVDLVPNHTSSEHPWFQEALAAEPGSDARARYLFRTGRAGGEEPPNNWRSVFGGPAWTRVGDTDQWYLHLFDPTQPDLDWTHPDVVALFDDVLRFWLDRGVDGFRVDVAHGLVKEAGLRDQVVTAAERAAAEDGRDARRAVRRRADVGPARGARDLPPMAPDPRRSTTATGSASPRPGPGPPRPRPATCAATSCTRRSTSTGCWPTGRRPTLGRVVEETLTALAEVGGEPTWVLSNHDVPRHPTRYGGGAVGLARARAATLVSLALPGSAYLYQGEELGLEDVDVAPGAPAGPVLVPHRQARAGRLPGADPVVGRPAAVRLRAGERPAVDPAAGRLGARSRSPPSRPTRTRRWRSTGGRSPPGASTLPTPATRSRSRSTADALTLRRGELTVVLNCGATPVPMPPGELLIASGAVDDTVPPDTAVWVRSR